MRLSALHGRLVHHTDAGGFREVDTVAEADGLIHDCPKCGEDHQVLTWCEGCPPEVDTRSPRWRMTGATLEDVSLHPSVHLLTGCCWHGWVRNGDAS